MNKIKPILWKHRTIIAVAVLIFVLGYLSITIHSSGYLYNLVPTKKDNYVLIIPSSYSLEHNGTTKIPKVSIYNALTNKPVKEKVAYLEEYGQYAALLKKGVYRVQVYYSYSRIRSAQLKILPGTEAYILEF